ncbi:hypothetical protein [Paraburkholderia sediminicola]|uniref:hypothetical protein n=1 Tax=Paraburkholderia sediminicola TaxID=458836 RepID=UPI0038B99DA7
MEQTSEDGICLSEVYSQARSAVADVRAGLANFERVLDSFERGDRRISRGYIEMIDALVVRGSVDVWYRGEYMTVPFRQLSEWIKDPIRMGAERHQIDEVQFRRWANSELVDFEGTASVPCNHTGCRQTRVLTFCDPREMQHAEVRAASEIWYCHHHRQHAWHSERALGDQHIELLKQVHDVPGCSRQQLAVKKRDTDFLVSIGLVQSATRSSGRALSFHLTIAGQEIVRQRLT